MGIKLKDYIQNPYEVFTVEEAEMIYKAAGFVDLESVYVGYKEIPLKAGCRPAKSFLGSTGIKVNYTFFSTVEYGDDSNSYKYSEMDSGLKLNISNVDFKGVA